MTHIEIDPDTYMEITFMGNGYELHAGDHFTADGHGSVEIAVLTHEGMQGHGEECAYTATVERTVARSYNHQRITTPTP